MSRDPSSYAGENPAYAWKVAMFTLRDCCSTIGERNGTSGSWKWRRSNRSRSRTSWTWAMKRNETVRVPTEPFVGTEKPLPIRMTSPSDARCRPWLLVRIRTS